MVPSTPPRMAAFLCIGPCAMTSDASVCEPAPSGKAELQGVDADTAVVMVVECPEEVVVIVDSVEGCTPDRMFVGEATEEGFGITTV